MAKIAVMGYGTIGSGVVKVLEENAGLISRRAGEPIEVKYVLDIRDFHGDPIESRIVHDINTIIEDPEIKAVVETMGGVNPAYEFTLKALKKGISVCTSNKEVVAAHGTEFLKTAHENGADYFFEASCGGGIPVIRMLNECLVADDIDEVYGILNGTTNFILTEMAEKGRDFDDALKDAQALGYAERDPSADIEGHDAGRKISILSSLAYGRTLRYEDLKLEGISSITREDMLYARELKMSCKLLAFSRKEQVENNIKYFAGVSPALVREGHPLYGVNGVFNAVYVHGNMLGDSCIYGRGAGSLPTASAVAADVVNAVRHPGESADILWSEEPLELSPLDTEKDRFFIRLSGLSSSEAEALFKPEKLISLKELPDELGLITGMSTEKELKERTATKGDIIRRIRIIE